MDVFGGRDATLLFGHSVSDNHARPPVGAGYLGMLWGATCSCCRSLDRSAVRVVREAKRLYLLPEEYDRHSYCPIVGSEA